MKLTALSIALVAALGMTAGCSTHTVNQAASPKATAADAEAQYALGRYYQGQERYELAIAAYRLALAAKPAHAGAHNGLGASLLLAGRNAEAIEQFKTGLKQHPRSAALWNNLGYAYALSGENQLAQIAYKNSLDIDPTDYKTNNNLAMAQQSTPQAEPALAAKTPASAPAETVQASAAPVKAVAAETAQTAAATPAVSVPATPAVAVAMAAPPSTAAPQINAAPAKTKEAKPAPIETAQASPPTPAIKLQPSTELAGAGPATAATTVEVAQVAPRVYELNLTETAATPVATAVVVPTPAPVAAATRLSVPLREDVIKTAAVDSDDFVLEIRNGNGVRRMAWRTSQYLADQGYTTKRLTNQRGFNVKVTRIFYLPGYLAEAQRLQAHMPRDTVLTETSNMRRGIHVRVVLGKDMVQHQAGLDAAPSKIQLAALQL